MQPENKYSEDLDYLSELGYEQVPTEDSDIRDLKKRIRSRAFSFKRFYPGLISLLIGMVIGGVVVLGFNTNMNEKLPKKNLNQEDPLSEDPVVSNESVMTLDTISIVHENFVNPVPGPKKKDKKPAGETILPEPSAEILNSKPIDLSLLNNGEINEKHLKFMNNSPVFYLHDLKITNYTTLYFKKEKFVKFTGVSAAYSNKRESASSESSLKHGAEYYLHKEIAQAMLYFKNGKYDQAIASLKKISDYNQEDLNCSFYLGMCYFYKKNYDVAFGFFDQCIQNLNNTFLQEAMYYKAVSLYEKNSREQAKELFRKIAETDGFYASKANEYLR